MAPSDLVFSGVSVLPDDGGHRVTGRSGAVITEVKLTLTGERQEFACLLLDRSADHMIVFYPIRRAVRIAGLTVPKGSESYGFFWRDRPYTVYHWVARSGRTLGFYVNIADDIQLRPGEVRWRDLALDLVFTADGGRVHILDEEELAGAEPDVVAKVASARTHLLTHRDALLAEVRSTTEHLRRRVRARSGKELGRAHRTRN